MYPKTFFHISNLPHIRYQCKTAILKNLYTQISNLYTQYTIHVDDRYEKFQS